MNEIIFEVTEDQADGGFNASALGYSINTQADSLDELREMVRDSVQCHFVEDKPPGIIRLHIVREEVLRL